MRRTQGEQEAVADYLTCLNALFDRLSPPWSEEEKVGYAHRNMLPRLQTMVQRDVINNLETLELLAIHAEGCCRAAQSYQAPLHPSGRYFRIWRTDPRRARTDRRAGRRTRWGIRAEIGRDRASYTGGAKRADTATTGGTSTAGTSGTTTAARGSQTAGAKCWNCDEIGHYARGNRGRTAIVAAEKKLPCARARIVRETSRVERGGRSTPASPVPGDARRVKGRELVYSAFGERGSPTLLFLRVRIARNEVKALVDSGSSSTFLVLNRSYRLREASGIFVANGCG